MKNFERLAIDPLGRDEGKSIDIVTASTHDLGQ